MFKPQLKRTTLAQWPSLSNPSSTFQRLPPLQRPLAQEKQQTLVPEAFFHDSRALFVKRSIPGLTGVINSCEYSYPKTIQDQISNEQPGELQYNEGIFCFHQGANIYFWHYDQQFLAAPKFLHHICPEAITAVKYQTVQHPDFGNERILLVVIAYGHLIRLYRLRHMDKTATNCIPLLESLMVSIYCPEVITNILVIPNRDTRLALLFGDANGKLVLFDFDTKKKHFTDTLKERIYRKAQQQDYSQILQIQQYKNYVFCLVNRYYEPDSLWKLIQKILKNPKAEQLVQQKLEIHSIETNNNVIVGFKKVCEYTLDEIKNKVKSSFSAFFEREGEKDIGQIQSLSLHGNFIQLMFTSGISTLVDQTVSFAEPPLQCIKKPSNLSIHCKNIPNFQQEILQNQVLLKSIGTSLMVFEGFVGSFDAKVNYFTPFFNRNIYIRSIHQIDNRYNNKYIILAQKNILVLQKLVPKLSLFTYCVAMSEQLPQSRHLPQNRKFEQKIDSFLDHYGEVQILNQLLELLVQHKTKEEFKINLRMDLVQMALKQMATQMELSYKQAEKSYEDNDKNFIKNHTFSLNKNIENAIWKIILRAEKVKIDVPLANWWNFPKIQAICMAFQVEVSEIYKKLKQWGPLQFCLNREEVYKIISHSKVLHDLISQFLSKEAEVSSTRLSELTQNWSSDRRGFVTSSLQGQSLKVKFCQLTKTTLQKLGLLLKVYDYVCEMDLNGNQIPMFSDLLFNFNQSHRINFSSTILKTLCINNEALIQNIIANIPELQLEQVRKFHLWQSTKQKLNLQDQNKTYDTFSEQDTVNISEFINQNNYLQIQNFYLTPQAEVKVEGNINVNNFQNVNGAFTYQSADKNEGHFTAGVTFLLKSYLRKIFQLRKVQIQVANVISAYERSKQDYFGVLQLPSLYKKSSALLKDIQFFTRNCITLLNKTFEKYSNHQLQKDSLTNILEGIKSYLTVEVRQHLQKSIKKYELGNLNESLSRRKLFSNNSNKVDTRVKTTAQLAFDQLSNETVRKYQL